MPCTLLGSVTPGKVTPKGEGDAEAHRIAHPDLDGDAAVLHEAHELGRERDDKTVEVCPRDVFEVAARADTVGKRALGLPS